MNFDIFDYTFSGALGFLGSLRRSIIVKAFRFLLHEIELNFKTCEDFNLSEAATCCRALSILIVAARNEISQNTFLSSININLKHSIDTEKYQAKYLMEKLNPPASRRQFHVEMRFFSLLRSICVNSEHQEI